MSKKYFDYEENFGKMTEKIKELKKFSEIMQINLNGEFESLEKKMDNLRQEKYKNLTPWEKVLISRHPKRPQAADYINSLLDNFFEFHGDRLFGDDSAIIAGIGAFDGQAITVLAHQKGKGTNERVAHNFGMPHPEGFRKVERLLWQSEKFSRPVLCFIDTPGAYPGVGAEERGQAGSIARLLMMLSDLKVPIISIVIGEGGSGGALALGVADRLLMLSNAVFSVISAEAGASIIFKDSEKAEDMANALKMTAQDLLAQGIIDEIIPEPIGGAHHDPGAAIENIAHSMRKNLQDICSQDINQLLAERYRKFRNFGRYLQQ